jgi:hypothetical protein
MEFMRVLKPGAAAFFQVPAGPKGAAAQVEGQGSASVLAEGAHQAEITVIDAPEAVRAGEVFAIKARIRNRSGHRWPSNALVRLGNHWKRGWRVVVLDDGRAMLPHEVPPGDETTVTLYVRAPVSGGRYELELDMVEEWITWFADRGSPSTSVPVRIDTTTTTSLSALVRRALRKARNGPTVPKMEMHWLKPAEVASTVAAAGGEVVSATEWDTHPAYEDYRYVAVRAN